MEEDQPGPPILWAPSISSDPAWDPQVATPLASGSKSVGFSVEAKEGEGAKEEDAAKEKEAAAAKIEADALELLRCSESAAAVLKVLPARAGAEKAVGAEKVVEVEEVEEVEAKQEAVGEATAEKRKSRYEYRGEEEMAQEVDDPDVLPDDLLSAGCAADRVQCMCSACAVHVQCLPLRPPTSLHYGGACCLIWARPVPQAAW